MILFAHGAGASSSSPFMERWSRRLERFGPVRRFDYPYMREGRKRPDPQARLVEAHRHELERAWSEEGAPIVLAGKSMGGRIGCHVAAERARELASGSDASPPPRSTTPVRALICFGFPLVSPGKQKKRRDAVLLALQTPVLFVQGDRDRLCPVEELGEVRSRMRAPSELHVVEGGDHSLAIGVRRARQLGLTQDDVDDAIEGAIARFLATYG